ncbi:tRNA threonylcarbamoyl adenosine modification protein YeaZ [Roseovarius nanhaiticus]|uniref:tRNA threonylcarbamoyl adenosine modification protein YeaZ n=1 Tax=Roseovarius nanhaiticus TaxID=573024 RepID=A0A1N7HK38_9RHOB|nr:tRNA (adenosine(37)-N6)-threonylcarbamoyltransferase complex dimerization subunit type 1 TsaB [Roseovarius nanhaiticus]SEL23943.1 tRNA threonylcarbamoyl adenosine modification protein YeaZ [Roseovarius nanhaiticus]SIS25131.1 tRNA threonylcarbamoyl adenosine modification protein YeaZ [Roseovarius nanhaiticus]
MSEPLILGVDTSGSYCSAVLLQGGDVLCDLYQDMTKGQVETLFPLLEDLMARGGADWSDLSAIGVGTGPGNFTGIRISVSAMRGLALSLGIRAVGVTLLDGLAHDAAGPVIAAIAAPRGQAYVAGYGMARALPPQLISIDALPLTLVEPGLISVGTAGAEIAAHLGVPHIPAAHAPGAAIARIATTRWQLGDAPAAPFYLKQADAAPARDVPPVMLPEAPL